MNINKICLRDALTMVENIKDCQWKKGKRETHEMNLVEIHNIKHKKNVKCLGCKGVADLG